MARGESRLCCVSLKWPANAFSETMRVESGKSRKSSESRSLSAEVKLRAHGPKKDRRQSSCENEGRSRDRDLHLVVDEHDSRPLHHLADFRVLTKVRLKHLHLA